MTNTLSEPGQLGCARFIPMTSDYKKDAYLLSSAAWLQNMQPKLTEFTEYSTSGKNFLKLDLDS